MFKGRLNRIQYWGCLLLLVAVYYGLRKIDNKTTVSEVIIAILFIPRLHDMGRTGWWFMILVGAEIILGALMIITSSNPELYVSLIGLAFILFALVLGVWPGQRGANRFGEPRPGLGIGKRKPSAS